MITVQLYAWDQNNNSVRIEPKVDEIEKIEDLPDLLDEIATECFFLKDFSVQYTRQRDDEDNNVFWYAYYYDGPESNNVIATAAAKIHYNDIPEWM